MGRIWQENAHPRPYQDWQALLFLRSVVIIIALIIFQLALRRAPHFLPRIFPSLEVTTKEMKAFGVTTTGGDYAAVPGASRKVLSSYTWVARALIVIVFLYIWEYLVVDHQSWNLSDLRGWNGATNSCYEGADCYSMPTDTSVVDYVSSVSAFFQSTFSWNLLYSCNKLFKESNSTKAWEQAKELPKREQMVICHKTPLNMSWARVLSGLALPAASSVVIVILFELLVEGLMRYTRRRWMNFKRFVDICIGISIIWFVGQCISDMISGVGDGATALLVGCVPMILFHARRLSSILRGVAYAQREAQFRKLEQTDLGLDLDEMQNSFRCGSDEEDDNGDSSRNARKSFKESILRRLRQDRRSTRNIKRLDKT